MQRRWLLVGLFSLIVILGFFSIFKMRKPRAEAAALTKAAIEKASGLATNELSISEHTLWHEDGEKPIVLEYNAGPECAKTKCDVILEAADRANDEFRTIAPLLDEGDAGDAHAKDGIYTRRINLNAKTYAQRVIKFRAKMKNLTSPLAYLNIGPKIVAQDFKDIRVLGEKYDDSFQSAAGQKDKLAVLTKQIAGEPGVETAIHSLGLDAILIVHKKGIPALLIKKSTNPKVMSAGSSSAFNRNFPGPTCGGWEGEVVAISPYAHYFGDIDPGVTLGNLLKDDPKERFRVQSFSSTAAGAGQLSWYATMFNNTNGIVLSSHGSSLKFTLAEVPERIAHLGRYDYNGTTWLLNTLSTNYFVTNPSEKESKLFAGSIFVNPKTAEAMLTPQFFYNMRGQMKPNSFAFLAACSSGADPSAFISAFRARGANVVYAFDNTVPADWATENAKNIADTILAGKKLADVPLHNPGTVEEDGKSQPVNMTVTLDDETGKSVSFPGEENKSGFTLAMKAGEKSVQLRPYGCFLHTVTVAGGMKVWTCRWTRTGEKDSAPSLNVNFYGEEPPKVGKAIHGFDAMVVYGERECTDFNSTSYPEVVNIKVTKWDKRKGEMAIELDSTLSNNGSLWGSGPDSFKLLKLDKAAGKNTIF